jgi:CO dehydrogenase/acetyl-CoA synthase beta subunit
MYKKYMNLIKKASKKNADVISNEICDKIASENAINNPESTIEEIKSETKDNIKNALNIEKSEENNG